MAWSIDTLAQAAFKKLFGLAHTEVKGFPLGNEAIPTQLTIIASDVYMEAIPSSAGAISGRIVACTNSTNGQTDSYLTVSQNLSVAPDGSGEGHAYLVTIPTGHGLIGQPNPITGGTYSAGDVVNTIIPKKFATTDDGWRPVLYDSSKVEIPPLSSLDWILDERGLVVIRDNSTAPAYLKCYVYVGQTLANATSYSGFSGYSGKSGFSGYSGSGVSGYSGYSGSSGFSGMDGTSVVLKGSVADYASLPGGAAQGDLWVTLDTGDGWVSDGMGGWSNVGQIQGPPGVSGFSGYSGVGASGFSGYSGFSGNSGFSGVSGLSGFSGYSGYSGRSGFSGYSGTSGKSGFSGVAGCSENYYIRFGNSSIYNNPATLVRTDQKTWDYDAIDYTVNLTWTGAEWTLTYNDNITVCTSQWSSSTLETCPSTDLSSWSEISNACSITLISITNEYSGTSGFSGYSGKSGFSGYSGTSGTSGFSGYSGYSGFSGTSGFSGYSGISGASGFSGYSGSGVSGYSGYSGYSGSGISGYSGYSGFSGFSGTSGTSGFSGYSGTSGTSGFSGYSGYSGKSGYSGYSGTSGFSGYSGSGVSGYSGYSGFSGISGTSGSSGYSGFSGYSGLRPCCSSYTVVVSGTFLHNGTKTYGIDDVNTWIQNAGLLGTITLSGGNWVLTVDNDVTIITYTASADLYPCPPKTGWTAIDEGSVALSDCHDGTSGFSGYSGYSGKSGYSGFSGFSGTSGFSGYSGTSGFSGYSGSGVSGYSGYSGTSGTSGFSGYSGTSGTSGFSGYSGTSGASGFSGYSGTSGTSGFSGYSGTSGASGFSGYSGTSGTSGFSGYSGTSGTSGFSGYSGYSGVSGYSGYSGRSGFSGYSGISGTSGFSGYSGSGVSGFSGYSGTSGTSGFSGYSGVSGYSGYSGVSGYSGYSGRSGFSGYSGTSGYSGYSGTSGYSGYSGSGVSGYSGYSGSGVSGYSGYSGFSGTSGFSGYSGISGTSGYSGYSGVSGFSGYSGISGTSGTSGFSGYSGSGVSGYSGYSGSGVSGYSGYSGYSGVSGFSGYSGTSGTSGFSGFSGTSGASGFSGYSGYSGRSGYSGYSGTSGFSGYSGTSGYSGISGTSGYSGLAAITYNTGGLFATYYDDTAQVASLSGRIILTEILSSINWTSKNPAGQTDSFSARITGWIKPGFTETYTFYVSTDDGARLWVGNTLVINTWTDQSQTTWNATNTIALTANEWYPIVIEHYENTGSEGLRVDWSSASQVQEILGATSSRIAYVTQPQGFSGTSGFSGYSGYSGRSGFSGYSGYSGISGYSGTSGTSGFSGYSGSGVSGYSGYSGYSGASGFSGYSGTSGASGFSGYSGTSGTSGYSGYSGFSGTSGFSGYSGSGVSGFSGYSGSGISGYSGYSGTSGTSGFSGYSGTSGTSGFSGYSGVSGFSGYSGYSGRSGYSGYSGTSGYSGYSGYSGSNAGWSRPYLFDTLTANSDPGSGNFRFGSTITFSPLRFNDVDASGSNNDGFFNQMNASSNAVKGYISLRRASNPLSVFAIYPVSSATDNTGWWNVIVGTPLVYNLSLGSLVAGDLYYFDFSLAGDSGYSGYSGTSGFSGYSGASGTSGFSGYSGSGVSGYSGYSGTSGTSGFSGYSGVSGTSGYSGYSGISGYSGYSGRSGFSGYSGTSGFSGYSGSGVSGYSGYSGSGVSGFSGYSGSGVSGYSGYSGISGFSGYSGTSGTSGFSGYSGVSGISGYSGYSGYSGSGVSGYSGFSGYSGYSGISGYSGYSGVDGCASTYLFTFSGYTGVSSVTYSRQFSAGQWFWYGGAGFTLSKSGSNWLLVVTDQFSFSYDNYTCSLPCPSIDPADWTQTVSNVGGSITAITNAYSGKSGYSGFSGYSGYSGKSGYSGISGYSGYSGSGVSGYSGFSGYSGSGVSGFSGYSGVSGTSGFSGYSGISGFSGASGVSGYSGYSGRSGYSGYSGTSGFSGYSGSGVSGFSGYSGSGVSGYSGYSGTSGFSGYSGISGYSGVSGSSGFSGYSGYSGRSGFSGYSGYSGMRACCSSYTVTTSGTGGDGTYTLTRVSPTRWDDGGTNIMNVTSSVWSLNIGVNNWTCSSVTFACPPKTTTQVSTTGWVTSDIGDVTLSNCYDGSSGYSGFSGYSGTSGTSGFSGYSGYSGRSGYSGYSGYSGSGTSGYSGYSGSGVSGYSGYSGYSGRSGFSGYSGYSGKAGCCPSYTITWGGPYGSSTTYLFNNTDNKYYEGSNTLENSGNNGYWSVTFQYIDEDTIQYDVSYSQLNPTPCPSSNPSDWQYAGGYYGSYSPPENIIVSDCHLGTSGFSGYSGYSGYSGTSGKSGFSGYSGSGVSGFSGYSGYSGRSGYSGYSGYSGSGTSGYSGYSGSGVSGYSGYSGGGSGFSGYSGAGTSGFSGYSGYSGTSGFSGYSGYSGRSGYSGYSGAGTSGFSGYSGTVSAPLTLTGTSDVAQLTVKANGTQTNPFIEFQNSSSGSLLNVKVGGYTNGRLRINMAVPGSYTAGDTTDNCFEIYNTSASKYLFQFRPRKTGETHVNLDPTWTLIYANDVSTNGVGRLDFYYNQLYFQGTSAYFSGTFELNRISDAGSQSVQYSSAAINFSPSNWDNGANNQFNRPYIQADPDTSNVTGKVALNFSQRTNGLYTTVATWLTIYQNGFIGINTAQYTLRPWAVLEVTLAAAATLNNESSTEATGVGVPLSIWKLRSDQVGDYSHWCDSTYTDKAFMDSSGNFGLGENLGSEKVTNGTFTGSATGWTLGTGWTYNSNNAIHASGTASDLEQNISAVAGERYKLVYTVSGNTLSYGQITPEIGGIKGIPRAQNGTFTDYITATGTGNLKFKATQNSTAIIDTVSVKKVTATKLFSNAGVITSGIADGSSAQMHRFDLANSPATKFCSPFSVTYGSNVIMTLQTWDSTDQVTHIWGCSSGSASAYIRHYIGSGGAGTYQFFAGQATFNTDTLFNGTCQLISATTATSTATQASSGPFELRNSMWTGATSAQQIHQIKNTASTSVNLESKLEFVMNRSSAGGGSSTSAGGYVYNGASSVWLASPVPTSAVADASLANSQMSFHLNETTTKLTVKTKSSGGTVRSATIPLLLDYTSTVSANAIAGSELDTDTYTQFNASHNANLTINNPNGTPVNGQKMIIRVKNTHGSTAITLSFGTSYVTNGYTLGSITAGYTSYYGFIYNSTSTAKWDLVGIGENINH